MPMPMSPAGVALGLGMSGVGGFGFGDQQESDAERRKRLAQLAQSQQSLTQQGSPATQSLFGGIGGFNGTGLLR